MVFPSVLASWSTDFPWWLSSFVAFARVFNLAPEDSAMGTRLMRLLNGPSHRGLEADRK